MADEELLASLSAKATAAAESLRENAKASHAVVICVNDDGLITIGTSLLIPKGLGSPETAKELSIAILKTAVESLIKRASDVKVEMVEQDTSKTARTN